MKVWVVSCSGYECNCVGVFDHPPGNDEILNAGFPCQYNGITTADVRETELEKVLNINLTS